MSLKDLLTASQNAYGDYVAVREDPNADTADVTAARWASTATREGKPTPFDLPTPEGWIYASEDRQYARFYASLCGLGTLYRVRLNDPEPSTEDPFPSWRARSGVVVSVLERAVRLTMKERKRLFIRWGGTEREFASMLHSVSGITTYREGGG